ncbi:GGDEF domain-containing protein [Thermaurantiacus sp.]
MAGAGWMLAGVALAAAFSASRTASTDALTGLGNRRGLATAFRADRGRRQLSFLDLSGFRAINAAHGHAVGDSVLQAVARRLEQALPAGSALFRHGGDEFVVLAPPAADILDAFTRALARPFPLPGGGQVQLGVWLGSAPPGAAPLEAALRAAITDMGRRRAETRARAAASARVQSA